MELVYHFGCFGFTPFQPVFLLPVSLVCAGLGTLAVGFLRKKTNTVFLWVLQSISFVMFTSQVVYFKIFKQPLLFAAVTNAGGMAIKNFWKEMLEGILKAFPVWIFLTLPLVATGLLLHWHWLTMHSHALKARLACVGIFSAGVLGCVAVLLFGSWKGTDYYEEYAEFYDPCAFMSRYGVLAGVQRDCAGEILPSGFFEEEAWEDTQEESLEAMGSASENTSENTALENTVSENAEEAEAVMEEPKAAVENPYNVLPIDFEKLAQLSEGSKELQKLNEYLQAAEPTEKNEYTGFFEGYNLIYLTAEGFSPYAVDETLTPTLYKLIHSGFVAEDYYVPLWQTSTSDGEYVNLTGLIPDQQFSMKRSSENEQPFSLPAYFAREGVTSYAYHNNTLSYYERHLSHPNLGYIFRASKLGDLNEEEWGSSVFPMENANAWPSSDLDMMKATIPEYIHEERFHVYYMTVSGHMNYNFVGNQMSKKNKEAVAELPYSEEGQAYIACNIELDKALEYLIAELDKAGKLDKTVICLSADHYPYAMEISNLEELAGKPLEGTLDIYRNNLILWNSKMETVEIKKACSALDLMPTLLNLFGFPYDSRLFAGHDMLSDSLPMVPFADRSFITDKVSYYKKDRVGTPLTEEPVDEQYLEDMRAVVRNLNKFSSGVINNNYYHYIMECLPEGWEGQP